MPSKIVKKLSIFKMNIVIKKIESYTAKLLMRKAETFSLRKYPITVKDNPFPISPAAHMKIERKLLNVYRVVQSLWSVVGAAVELSMPG